MVIRLSLADRSEGLRQGDGLLSLATTGEEGRPRVFGHQLGDGAEVDLEHAILLDRLRCTLGEEASDHEAKEEEEGEDGEDDARRQTADEGR